FHPALSGGIHIIPALIGLFAIPQVITLLAQGRQHNTVEIIQIKPHAISQAWHEVITRIRALSTGTIIGSVVGLIPGVGGQIAGLVAYNQARNFSPERDKFGTGHPEGIIAAESANNAMVGPSLIPLLTLSIPGSPTAAVLLGGLIIHGIFPGPAMFTTHAEVVWPFINSMLLGQILMCVSGLFIARFIVQIVHTPHYIMAAMVLMLAVFGSYAVQHSLHDVFIMLALGIGMYFLERHGYSAAPLVLGLILGPIAEGNFVEGMMIAQAQQGVISYFFTGTLNLILITLVVASISYSIWSEMRKRTG
ncbi:MAG: tripartite tricarboxylate transporter permease, partial [Pseudomonadota bacterium]